ncbi:hypothetical protein TcCL_NonESM12818, partial [Trypanosoma cruzi]
MRSAQTHGRNERDGTHPSPRRCPSLPSAPQRVVAGGVQHSQLRHGAHHPLSSECTQQAGAQSPSCHRNGEHKQSSSRNISASSRKEREAIGACQQHGQQRDKKRDTRTQSGSGHGTE